MCFIYQGKQTKKDTLLKVPFDNDAQESIAIDVFYRFA